MRISDWSSDVCSSDLALEWIGRRQASRTTSQVRRVRWAGCGGASPDYSGAKMNGRAHLFHITNAAPEIECRRSEERRVGKECVSKCRSRWSPYHSKNTSTYNSFRDDSIMNYSI